MEAVRAMAASLLSDKVPAQYTCQIWFTSSPDQLGSTGQKRAEWFLHTSLLTDQVHLDKTWHSQPELNWIWAGFAQYYPGRLWKNRTKSESLKLVACRLHSATTGPNDSCTTAHFQTGRVWLNPDQAIQIRSGSVLHNMIHAFFGKTELKTVKWMQ